MAARVNNVELGFVEKSPPWRLLSQFFPSKVGGKPAWLNLKEVPKSQNLFCPNCNKTMVFLLQIYCPPPPGDEDDATAAATGQSSCFHRTLYVFCCREATCHQTSNSEDQKSPFAIFRCQLARRNDFYSYEPPDEDNQVPEKDIISPMQFDILLCDVCGCNAGNRKCGKCQKAVYCCKDHQVMDWKMGHKAKCGKEFGLHDATPPASNKFLFPEFELVTEPESEEYAAHEDEENIEKGSSNEDLRLVGASLVQTAVELENGCMSAKDLDRMARKETEDDVQFMNFKKRISHDPDQVLRYQKGGRPLFVSANDQPSEKDIVPCSCGAKRQFEFQIMPQLLTHLDVDSLDVSIDWGTLLIYTCSKSCTEGPPYHPEFLWKQDYHNSSIS
ncbi:programmed cell death protein 2-like [Lytechinus variegatus]|uniref:programmed cell death protein 2-like n=1 Tax=Lytechinus variegatus TaxID=7654 RepID=UPI001BB1A1DB|nr:programmed cell death protein 2-like [Lytechinus variegatus]